MNPKIVEAAARAIYDALPNGGVARIPSTESGVRWRYEFRADTWDEAPDRHDDCRRQATVALRAALSAGLCGEREVKREVTADEHVMLCKALAKLEVIEKNEEALAAILAPSPDREAAIRREALDVAEKALEEIKEVGTRTVTERVGDMYDANGYEDHEQISREAEVARAALTTIRALIATPDKGGASV